MPVHADLAAIEPEGLVNEHLVRAPCLRDDDVGDAQKRPIRIIAARKLEDMLGLIDLGIGVLGQQHRAIGGDLLQRNERVTHGNPSLSSGRSDNGTYDRAKC